MSISALTTVGTGKVRSVKQYYMTSADGDLVSTAVIIKDYSVKDIIFQHLSDDADFGQLWVIFGPIIRKAALMATSASSSAAAAAAAAAGSSSSSNGSATNNGQTSSRSGSIAVSTLHLIVSC